MRTSSLPLSPDPGLRALETDYDNYKAESEKTITTLKEALDDARKLSTDALDRNKKLLKEFRYLRTVIVTAAVYWGFNSKLRLR